MCIGGNCVGSGTCEECQRTDDHARRLLTSWVYNARTIGGQEMSYGRTVHKALYWAGIDQDEWFDLAENKTFWSRLTHGEWNGTVDDN